MEDSIRTASVEWIPDGGAWQFQGYDENGLLISLTGRPTGAHKVLCSAAEIACKRRQDFHLGHDGGYMIPIHSKNGQGMRNHFEKLVNWYGKNELIPAYLENKWAGSSGRWVWDPAGSLAGMRRRPFWLKDDAASKQ